jgi:hypothetical protein
MIGIDDANGDVAEGAIRVEVVSGRHTGRHGLLVGQAPRGSLTSFTSGWVRWDHGREYDKPGILHMDSLAVEATGAPIPEDDRAALPELSVRDLSRSDLSSSLVGSLRGGSRDQRLGSLQQHLAEEDEEWSRGPAVHRCPAPRLCCARARGTSAYTPGRARADVLRHCINGRRRVERQGPLCLRRATCVVLALAAALAPLLFGAALAVRLAPAPMGYHPELASQRAAQYNAAARAWDDGCPLNESYIKKSCGDGIPSNLDIFAQLEVSLVLPRLDASTGLSLDGATTRATLPTDFEANPTASYVFTGDRTYALASPPRCTWSNMSSVAVMPGSADCAATSAATMEEIVLVITDALAGTVSRASVALPLLDARPDVDVPATAENANALEHVCTPPRGWDPECGSFGCCMSFRTVTALCLTIGLVGNVSDPGHWGLVAPDAAASVGRSFACGAANDWEMIERRTAAVGTWAFSESGVRHGRAPALRVRILSAADPSVTFYSILGAGVSIETSFELPAERAMSLLFWSIVGGAVACAMLSLCGTSVFALEACHVRSAPWRPRAARCPAHSFAPLPLHGSSHEFLRRSSPLRQRCSVHRHER